MREFKVIRLNTATNELYEDFLMFKDEDALDLWAMAKNEEQPGSVLDAELVSDVNHSENKYEY